MVMNKKLLLVLAFILSFGILSAGQNAFADFTQYTIVGAIGDKETNEKLVFGFNETPYLYMKLPDTGNVFTGSFWRDPDASISYVSTKNTGPEASHISASGSGLISGLDRWITLSNWDTVKKVGEWEVNSNYFHTNGSTGFSTASFTVTPEPIAMVLFVIGGLPIAASLYRNRNKNAITV